MFKWTILIKFNGQLYKGVEDNDINKLGYHIYTKLIKPNYTYEIYIRNNADNQLMRIDPDCETESMIGVDHPEDGHIGYLPFAIVTSI